MKIFLAGPIFNLEKHEAYQWRKEVERALIGAAILNTPASNLCEKHPMNCKTIVERNKTLIDQCDIFLANHIKPSVGTSMEILYAWERNKKIFLVSSTDKISPWLIYHSSEIFTSLELALKHINKLLDWHSSSSSIKM